MMVMRHWNTLPILGWPILGSVQVQVGQSPEQHGLTGGVPACAGCGWNEVRFKVPPNTTRSVILCKSEKRGKKHRWKEDSGRSGIIKTLSN